MASYRFCRSDDVPLLVRAHEACFRPHFPGLEQLDLATFRRVGREIDLWTSSCMVASAGDDPVAVLLAAKRDTETLVWRIGVRPDQLRRGHGGHLLTSLGSKLSILGPPRMVAELPADRADVCTFFEACGWRREVGYTDFVLPETGAAEPASDLVVPITVDELIANDAFDTHARRSWDRSPATLVNRRQAVQGLAVASDVRIEAHLLFDEDGPGGSPRVLALGAAEEQRREMWLGLLVRQLAGSTARPIHYPRVHPAEISFNLLRSWGFESGASTFGFARVPTAA